MITVQMISGLTAGQVSGLAWAMGVTFALMVPQEVLVAIRRRGTRRAIERHLAEHHRAGKPLHPSLRNRTNGGVS